MSIEETLLKNPASKWNQLKSEEFTAELGDPSVSRHRRNFLFHRQFQILSECVSEIRKTWAKEQLFQALLQVSAAIPLEDLPPTMEVIAHALQTLEHDKTITRGLEAYMSDVKLMTELRLYFDQLIMDTLNGHYVDQRDLRMPEYSEFLNSSYKEVTRAPLTITVTEDIQDRLHLSELVSELEQQQKHWISLMDLSPGSKAIQTDLFDKTSRSEVLAYASYTSLEPYMRLIPDALIKCELSIHMAKSIWSMCDRRMRESVGKTDILNDTLSEVKIRLNDVSLEVEILGQRRLEMEERMASLSWDGDKFEEIRNEYEDGMAMVTRGEIDIYDLNKTKTALYDRWKRAESTGESHAFNCAYDRYLECRRTYMTKKSDTAVLRYKMTLLKDSLDLETQLRCSKLRSRGAVEEESDEVNDQLEQMREEMTALQIESKALEDAISFREESDDQPLYLEYYNHSTAEKSSPENRELTKLVLHSRDELPLTLNLKEELADEKCEENTDEFGRRNENNVPDEIITASPQFSSKVLQSIEKLDNQLSAFQQPITTEDITKKEDDRKLPTPEITTKETPVPQATDNLYKSQIGVESMMIDDEHGKTLQKDVNLDPLDTERTAALVNRLDASSTNPSASAKPVKTKATNRRKHSSESKLRKPSLLKKK